MDFYALMAVIITLAAALGYLNNRLLKLPTTIASLHRHTGLLFLITIFASLNRESAILIPLIVFATRFYDDDLTKLFKLSLALFFTFVATRYAINYFISAPGVGLQFFNGPYFRLSNNLEWLSTPSHLIQFLMNLLMLPVLLLFFLKTIPKELRFLPLIALLYLCGLFFVGNVYEPRIFGEVIILMYIPFIIGLVKSPSFTKSESDDRHNH